jgi:NifU-like protein involved in Fe-S cluster formation
MLPVVGAVREDDEGRFARFSLRVDGDMIVDVRFQVSPCVTLVAYCELAADLATGQTLAGAASRVRPVDLSGALPHVPAAKRARALLASQALTAAIVTAVVPAIVPSIHSSFDSSIVRAAAVARADVAEGAHP